MGAELEEAAGAGLPEVASAEPAPPEAAPTALWPPVAVPAPAPAPLEAAPALHARMRLAIDLFLWRRGRAQASLVEGSGRARVTLPGKIAADNGSNRATALPTLDGG